MGGDNGGCDECTESDGGSGEIGVSIWVATGVAFGDSVAVASCMR